MAKDLSEIETEKELKEWFKEHFPLAELSTDENNHVIVRLNIAVDLGGLLFPVD